MRGERQGAGDDRLGVQVRANCLGYPRVGIVVPRRLGGAVVRNRIRRRLRADARQALPDLGGFDVVLLPRRSALGSTAPELWQSLTRVLQRARVSW